MISRTMAGLLGALFLLTGPLAAVASSAPPDSSGVVERGDGTIAFIYWSDGYLAMVGSALDFCLSEEGPVGPGGMEVSPPNGGVIQFSRSDVFVSVYEYPGPGGPDDPVGGFEFLGANCAAIFDDNEETVPIEAVATGEVRLRAKFRTDADGITNGHNSLVGRVTTAGGEAAHLSTFAQVTLGDGGATLIDLKQLRVHYGG